MQVDAVRDVGGNAKDGKRKKGDGKSKQSKVKGKHDKSSGSDNDGQGTPSPSVTVRLDTGRSGSHEERIVAN